MDQTWWQLHVRTARGELLNEAERAAYVTGLRALESQELEHFEPFGLAEARALVASLESERKALEARRMALDAEIAVLERTLEARACQVPAAGG